MTLFLLIAAVSISLSVSAVCSLLEATLLSLTPGQVAGLKRTRPRAGEIWERFKQDVEQPISVILICNTAAHTIGATVAGAEFEKLMAENFNAGGWSVLVFGAVFTVLMLQFTEILPKTLGVRHSGLVAAVAARPMGFMVWLMRPLLKAVQLINKPFERGGEPSGMATIDEIATLAAAARGGKVIDAQQEKMIRTAGKLGHIRVRQVMTHRRDVQFLRLTDDFASILRTLRDSQFTRLPVVQESLDKIVGVVHLRDVFKVLALVPGRMRVAPDPERPDELMAIPTGQPGGDLHAIGAGAVDLAAVMRPIPFVPETQPIGVLLKQFQTGTPHIAAVVDEYGATVGIVTLEDVLEELVGDIEDEFDEHDPSERLQQVDEGWRCSGELPVRTLAEQLNLHDDLFADAPVVTLNGWVTTRLSRWPQYGDKLPLTSQWIVRIDAVEGSKITSATILPTPKPTPPADTPA